MNRIKIDNWKESISSIKLINVLLWAFIFSGLILLADIYDIPSSVIRQIPMEARIIIISLLLFVLILVIYNSHFLDLYKLVDINIIDRVIICILNISIICAYVWGFWFNQYAYKWVISSILSVLLVCALIGRQLVLRKYEATDAEQNTVFDLKDIYEGEMRFCSQKPILISEKDVDYDLLNRSGIINQLYMSIASCKSNSAFVIGLEGEWGSGKTTIINSVKRKLQESDKSIIVIDNIDPWMYGTQDALLVAMYDSILQATGIRYRISHEKKIIRSLSNIMVDNYNAGNVVRDLFFPDYDDYEDSKETKKKLSQYIKRTSARIVFFIDNMDRAEGDNIIFLLRLIGTIFDLPNIIYVLSYDSSRLNGILENSIKINPKYVEKIINQQIKIPMLQEERLRQVYGTCIHNILECYGMKKQGILDLQPVIEVIYAQVKDLRMFKRLINTTFVSTFCQDNYLYKKDLLGLEMIRFLEPELYSIINEHRTYFVSHDRPIDKDLYFESFDKKKFNSESKIFFESLFDKYGEYKNLLTEMFPYVKRFVEGNDLQPEYPYPDSDYKEISRKARICSRKYFDLYFSYGSNDYLSIGKEISEMVDDIIKATNDIQLYDYMCNKIANVTDDIQREWFERLESYLDLIPRKKKIILAKAIFDCLNIIDSSQIFMGLNAQIRATLIVEQFLEESEINMIKEFVEGITNEYDKLYMIDQIIYWFQSTRSQHIDDVKIRENIMKEKFSDMCERVVVDSINLYDDSYYSHYNIWGLIRYLKIKKNREDIIHAYIAKIINEKIVFRVMWDIITQSMGSGYGYKINDDNFKLFFEDENILDALLKDVVPKSQSEEFVLRVYQTYKESKLDNSKPKEILTQTEMKVNL